MEVPPKGLCDRDFVPEAKAAIREELLDDGMEGLTQLPHLVPSYRHRYSENGLIACLQGVLAELVGDGRIIICRSHWTELENPVRLGTEEAIDLLRDPFWFSFHLNDEPEDRLQFINVDNLLEVPAPGERFD